MWHKVCMEMMLIVLVICLILALKPVKKEPSEHTKSKLYPPAITRKLETSDNHITYQLPRNNSQIDDLFKPSIRNVGNPKQSMTRVKVETFTYDGKTFLAIEQNGVLIVREDS